LLTHCKTILYIHHGKGLGGAPISLLTLIKGLDRTLYRPLVLFLYDSQALELFKQEGIETIGPVNLSDFSHTQVYWFRWYHLHHAIKALAQTIITLLFTAPRLLRTIKPDLIHLNTSSLIAWGIVAKRLNIPVVWHIRESLAAGYVGLRRTCITKIIQHCATVIVPICATDGRFWPAAKKKVVYNPVDTSKFSPAIAPAALPQGPQYLLFVGGLSYQKGSKLMLEVFAAIHQLLPNTKLIIAGNFTPPLRQGLKRFSPEQRYAAQTYALYETMKDNVILTGPTTTIPALMQTASIIFFPAQVDHFARPVIEAGCMAKPVIASDLPQLREVIKDQSTGFLLNPTDHAAWVQTIINLLTHPDSLAEMGHKNYDFCYNKFRLEQYSQAIKNLYENILQKN
jgi:glycosyltransferase involved in cell wall biosynthesis